MIRITTTITVSAMALALGACSADPEPAPTASPDEVSASASAAALDDGPLDEQLLEAVQEGDLQVAVLALDAGADPDASTGDASGNTAFTLAITRGDGVLVQALIDAGATLEDSATGWSALATAAVFAGPDVLAIVLDAGADPNGVGPGAALPLAQAAYEGNVDAMLLLLEAGADANGEVVDADGFGYTPLFSAAFGGSREAADVLLQWGADPAWEAVDGTTAGGWAAAQGHRELGEYLDSLVSSEE